MKWHERALIALIALSSLAMWLPWVWHRAAALVLTGLDLHEFIRFMGEVRTGEVRAYSLPLCSPLLVTAVVLAGIAGHSRWSVYGKGTLFAFAAWLVTVIFPPLEQPTALGSVWVLLLGAFFAMRFFRPRAGVRVTLLLIACLGASLPPVVQFALLLPALGRLYGKPVTLGVGFILEVGVLFAALTLGLSTGLMRRGSARPT